MTTLHRPAHVRRDFRPRLTPQQERTLDLLPPRGELVELREVGKRLGHRQPTGAGKTLWALRKAGLVETVPFPARDHGRVWWRL